MTLDSAPSGPITSCTRTLLVYASMLLVVAFAACDYGGLPPDKAAVCNDTPTQCTTCHGSDQNAAPPADTARRTETTEVTVGAHQAHLGLSAWHREITCQECHIVPTAVASSGHIDGSPAEVTWGTLARARGVTPLFERSSATCAGTYCHGGAMPLGGGALTTPTWTQVDGSQAACGACHGLPPDPPHVQSGACVNCHDEVVNADLTFADPSKHIDSVVQVRGGNCTSCHGDPLAGNAAPPTDTQGNLDTSLVTVGAHQAHLGASTWHRPLACDDCHVVPGTADATGHIDPAPAEVTWGTLAQSDGAAPAFDRTATTCSNVYCHGTTLAGPDAGGAVSREPSWTVVDGTYDACGSTCHTNPPGGSHPANEACELCHGTVVSAYDPVSPDQTVWADASLHVNGTVEVAGQTCTSCHGNAATGSPEPPLGTQGETLTSQAAVGAHAQHLGASTWHRAGQCTDCHLVPLTMDHQNDVTDFSWGGPSAADGAAPGYTSATVTCAGTYCHGTTLAGPKAGGTVDREPEWTIVDGTHDACGTTCHTNPPGGSHVQSTACESCHGAVNASYNVGNPAASTWTDAARHVDGVVDVVGLTCTSCHGNEQTGAVEPPLGTQGETLTSQAAVGAHAQHLGASTWHRAGQCTDCHTLPASMGHSNSVVDFAWGGPSAVDGASPDYSVATTTCSGTYCHGSTLLGAVSGGSVDRTPDWTEVNNTWDECGTTCHTNPPGGSHPSATQCETCHGQVISAYDDVAPATSVWANAGLHVDGMVQVSTYHDLGNWTAPEGNANHHGSHFFIENQQRDEHSQPCTDCHGANLDGGTSGVSCDDTSAGCHNGRDYRACDFCHGQFPLQYNPPAGVAGEIATSTLAVGRHTAHLAASTTHVAFACDTCHVVPPVDDLTHALGYQPSTSLATTGHHGDVTFSGRAVGMTWNVAGTQGNPVTARGTCLGACHSNGRGGAPTRTPYWAGGNWPAGNCGSCHQMIPSSGEHPKHVGGENMACTECHPDASTTQHMNGTPDFTGAGMSYIAADPGCTADGPSCDPACHGRECW